ncbi:MAG: HdeA/HdeB family chaperone [Paracoccaceae bacterium]
MIRRYGMKVLPLTTLALILAMASPAAAYTVKGSVECPDVVKEDANENYRKMNMWWILGYFTGRNYEQDVSVGKGIDAEDLYAHVLSYCKAHPGNDMDDASIDLYNLLR